MAKVSRRGFFGRAVGGFAAALGLAKVASGPSRLDVLLGSRVLTPAAAYNAETGAWLTSKGRWEGTIHPSTEWLDRQAVAEAHSKIYGR
jgi:hypothetical protein